jgi:hypothetical protein
MSTDKPNKTPCPKCGHGLRLGGFPAGEKVCCPKCYAAIIVGGEAARGAKSAAPEEISLDLFDESLIDKLDRTASHKPPPTAASLADAPPPPGGDFVDDDDAYLPEIPLNRSTIGNDRPSYHAPPPLPMTMHSPLEKRREVDWNDRDAIEMEDRHRRAEREGDDLYTESAKRRGLVRHYITPDPPRWTFLSGVFGYPWRGVNLARWTAMSFGLSLAVTLGVKAIEALGLLEGNLTGVSLLGLFIAIAAIGMTILAMSFSITSCVAALQDTADGHDLPQDNTFPEWDQWLFTLLSWTMVGAAAAAVGFPLSLKIGPIAFAISFLLLFPILLLSAMEADSFIMPFSPPVLRSLAYYAHGWLMFYLVSTGLIALAAYGFDHAYRESPLATLVLSGPVLAALLLIYARLVGRLAWKASGAPIAPIELDGEPPELAAALDAELNDPDLVEKQPKRGKRGSRVLLEVPDDLIERNPHPEPPPRIDLHGR